MDTSLSVVILPIQCVAVAQIHESFAATHCASPYLSYLELCGFAGPNTLVDLFLSDRAARTMLAHRYQIWDWADRISAPDDVSEQYRVGVIAIAKRDTKSRYEVFNELVAMHLGRLIGLPIPAGVIFEKEKEPFYASMKVGIIGESKLPAGDIEAAVANCSDDCCGTVVFDAWISNVDRHDRNYWYDEEDRKLFLFDHGCALLNRVGISHLTGTEDSVAISPENSDFVSELHSLETFDDWLERICSIPAEVIHSTVREASSTGVPEGEAIACGQWLIRRRTRLKDLFKTSLSQFTNYKPGLFDPFREPPDDSSFDYCI